MFFHNFPAIQIREMTERGKADGMESSEEGGYGTGLYREMHDIQQK